MDRYKKALMIIAIIAIVAIAGSLIYYFVFFKPGLQQKDLEFQKEKYQIEQKEKQDNKQEELNKKTNLLNALADLDKWHSDSLDQAYKDYSAQWKKACEDLGGEFTSPSESPLPKATVETLNEYYNQAIKRIDESYQSQKDDIYKLFE